MRTISLRSVQLRLHEKGGKDKNGRLERGHPECEFCLHEGGRTTSERRNPHNNKSSELRVKKRFYDLDALHSHLRHSHEKCYICSKQVGERSEQRP